MLELYKETAFELRPGASSQRIDVPVPRANGSYDRSKFSKKLERGDRLATDEKSFAAEYLASSSSVFFHHSNEYPRCFLWRVVGKDKLLEFSSVDFAHKESETEAATTIAFEFQDRIAVRGVEVCSAGSEAFHAFVLTQENEIFEIQLQPEYFQQSDLKSEDAKSWCKPVRLSALSIEKVFRIYPTDPQSVFVAYTSGKIEHWTRERTDNAWSAVGYDDRPWGSALFSLVSRKGSPDISYNGSRIAANTAHAMAQSGHYLFTACLNHTLRIWHLPSGKLVDSRDLLNEARSSNETVQLNPAEPGYVQFLPSISTDEKILLSVSPLNGGQVKLWRVRNCHDDDPEMFRIEDLFEQSRLSLPDPDPTGTNVWSLAGFRVIQEKQSKEWQAWVLWRNHNYHKAYSFAFSLSDVVTQWKNDWVTVSQPSIRQKVPDFAPDDMISQQWLKFISFPGRYSRSVLETALAQYSGTIETRLSSADRARPLQERLHIMLTSHIRLTNNEDSTPDHGRYARECDQQWRRFWRILESLNESRFAPLSLALDSQTESLIFVMTDAGYMLRESSNLELLQASSDSDLDALPHLFRARFPQRKLPLNTQERRIVSTFLTASDKFLLSFPPELKSSFLLNLDEELYWEEEPDVHERIVNFYNTIDLADALPSESEKDLMKSLESIGGLDAVTDNIYEKVFSLMKEHKSYIQKTRNEKSLSGIQLMLSGLRDEITILRQTLQSMFAVVIYIDETDKFHPSQHFEALLDKLRIQEKNIWLATNYRTTGGSAKEEQPVSILEDVYGQIIRPRLTEEQPMSFLLTQHILDNLEWISTQNNLAAIDDIYVSLQCHLLRYGETKLAEDFLRFQPRSEWSTYVKGRLDLSSGNRTAASTHFKEATQGMSTGKARGRLQDLSLGLLSAEEAACFYSGQALYLQHIMSLFERVDAYDEVIDFAQLTLEALNSEKKEPRPNFKQSILLRLFQALLKTRKDDEAYDTLIQFSDPLLQRTSSTDLIDGMLKPTTTSNIVEVVKKIQSMPISSHPYLSTHIDHHLAALAKNQTSIPSAGGKWISNTSIDYLSILHALRLHKKDYRGAVSVLFDRLRIIQKSGRARSDPQAVALRHALLALINAMTAVKEDEAYVIVEAAEDPRISGTSLKRFRGRDTAGPARKRQRVIVTLDDLRREYQKVLDKCSRIERGDFELNDNEDSEEEQEEDETWHGSKLVVDRNRSGVLSFDTDRMEVS